MEASEKDENQKKKEKILFLKRQVLSKVEELLEQNCDQELFLKNCGYLCKTDYDDIIIERAISNYCGYALCSKNLTGFSKLKQKYKIVLNTHQVFDITERKNFCSNLCFTKSNFVRNQLAEEPLWIRDKGEENVNLLNINLYINTKEYIGDEVKLDLNLMKDMVYELHKQGDSLKYKYYCNGCCENRSKIKKCSKNCLNKSNKNLELNLNFPYINEQDLEKLKDKMTNMKIKEKNQLKPILNTVIEKTSKIDLCKTNLNDKI